MWSSGCSVGRRPAPLADVTRSIDMVYEPPRSLLSRPSQSLPVAATPWSAMVSTCVPSSEMESRPCASASSSVCSDRSAMGAVLC